MGKKNGSLRTKIMGYENIASFVKPNNKKITLVGGCFDIFHYGHLVFLSSAKEAGDLLIIALEADEFIRKYKKREPVHTQDQRAEILSQMGIVDVVIKLPLLKGYDDYFNLVKTVAPSIIAVTEGDTRLYEKQQQAQAVGAQLKIVCPLSALASTTNIIEYATIFSN